MKFTTSSTSSRARATASATIRRRKNAIIESTSSRARVLVARPPGGAFRRHLDAIAIIVLDVSSRRRLVRDRPVRVARARTSPSSRGVPGSSQFVSDVTRVTRSLCGLYERRSGDKVGTWRSTLWLCDHRYISLGHEPSSLSFTPSLAVASFRRALRAQCDRRVARAKSIEARTNAFRLRRPRRRLRIASSRRRFTRTRWARRGV